MRVLISLVRIFYNNVKDFYYLPDRELRSRKTHFLAFVSDHKFYEVLGQQQRTSLNALINPFSFKNNAFAVVTAQLFFVLC